jgi:phosphoenolpyruvate synthase/pyruvate phosphate dikinase
MLVGSNGKSIGRFGKMGGIEHDSFVISDVVWRRYLAQAETRQICGEDGFIHGKANDLVSAYVVHDEVATLPRRKVC